MDKTQHAKWFGKQIRTMVGVTGRTKGLSRSEVRAYWNAVQEYPLEQVREAIQAITRTFVRMVTPGDLRAGVSTVRARIAREAEYAKPGQAKSVDPRGLEYDRIKKAAAPMFARRLLQMRKLPLEPPGQDDYTGEFDLGMVVNGVPIPDGQDLHNTMALWKSFFDALGFEYDTWKKAQQA